MVCVIWDLRMSDKQLYHTFINGKHYYCWSTEPAKALKRFRNQALKFAGRYKITELSVRETNTEGKYVWKKLQLTTKLLSQSCGQSS